MRKKFIHLFCLILFIVMLYLFFIKYYFLTLDSNILSSRIEFNRKNEILIKNKFINILQERLDMLKNISYDEWIEYNKQNKTLDINGHKYHVAVYLANEVYSNLPNNKIGIIQEINFINKVSYNKDFENSSFDDIYKIINNNLLTSFYRVDKNFILNLYTSRLNITELSYYWVDLDNHKYYQEQNGIIQYNAISMKYKKGDISGVIFIPYSIKDALTNVTYKYYNFINKRMVLFFILLSFIVGYILCYINYNNNSLIPYIVVLSINLYIIYYLNQISLFNDFENIKGTYTNINSSTLSIAFLISANIFIINYFSRNKNYIELSLYYSSLFLFCYSMLLLLLSLYQKTSIIYNQNYVEIYLIKELLFNLVILINILIVLFYIYHIGHLYKKAII